MVSFKTNWSHYPLLFRLSLFIVLYVILFLPSLTFAFSFCENRVNTIHYVDVHSHVLIPGTWDYTFLHPGWDKVVSTPGLTYESNIDLINSDERSWERWGGLKGWVWTEPYTDIYAYIHNGFFQSVGSVECGTAASYFEKQLSTLLSYIGTPPSTCGYSELAYWSPIMIYVVEPGCYLSSNKLMQRVIGIYGVYAVYLRPPNSPSPPPSPPPPVEASCDVRVNISHSEVWPQAAGNDDKTTSTIMIRPTGTTPAEGCTVNFRVEPIENSGGHSHDGDRRTGNVFFSDLRIPGSSSNPVYAIYSSLDVSGQERIRVEVNENIVDEKTITVKVPDLLPLEPPSGSSFWYNLTGSTSSHSANHYGTNSTNGAVYNIASDYWNETQTRLGINDLSLEWGGLFDVNENWNSPHSLHRTGESVDIDRCADGVLVNQRRLNEIAIIYGGERIIEDALRPPPCSGPADTPRIHYEFSEGVSRIQPSPPDGGGGDGGGIIVE